MPKRHILPRNILTRHSRYLAESRRKNADGAEDLVFIALIINS